MNCPSHHLFFGFKKHSYRDLPLRLHTQDVLHRNEAAGALGGLTRVRQFAQDDAHIYCTRGADRRRGRSASCKLLDHVYNAVGLKYVGEVRAPGPRSGIGDDALWDRAEAALEGGARRRSGCRTSSSRATARSTARRSTSTCPTASAASGSWAPSSSTTSPPERFDLTYIGEDNAEHRPVVLHRAIYGCFERFIAILIEHFAGAFPAWLAPVQVDASSPSPTASSTTRARCSDAARAPRASASSSTSAA